MEDRKVYFSWHDKNGDSWRIVDSKYSDGVELLLWVENEGYVKTSVVVPKTIFDFMWDTIPSGYRYKE